MAKYRVYIDEVGNSDLGSSENPNHRFLSLTGIIFDLEYVKSDVVPKLNKLKQDFFNSHPDEPIILHRKEIVNKKFPFKLLRDEEIEKNFNEAFLELLSELDYTVVSVLLDKKEHNSKYTTWRYDPYHYSLEVMLERFLFFLEENQAEGDVMVESRGGKEDRRLKNSYSRIFEHGTNFIDSERIKIRFTSKELKVKPKMLNIAALQLSDLIAHPSRRFMFRHYGLDEGKSFVFGDEIINVIENKYYQKGSKIEGYGIKLLP